MDIITDKVSLKKLASLAEKSFANMVKAVVDINREIMVIDAEMHSDQESLLLQKGSRQEDLWGINIYPELEGEDMVEFDSMINIRPFHNNRSRYVEDKEIREKIIVIVNKLMDIKS